MGSWIWRGLGLIGLVGLAVAVAWHYFGPLTVEALPPKRGPAVQAVYGSGTVEPSVMLPIAPKVMGRLQHLLVDEGAQVYQGQPLAELDNRELAASVAEWEARVRFAEAQHRRAAELDRGRVGTETAFDQTRNELDTAKAALERARRQLAEMTLVAPAGGTIIKRDGEIGQLMRAGDAIFWMSCCAGLRITAEIDEEEIATVKPGQKVLIRADAFQSKVFEGRVAEITPKGDPVARSFRVRIKLPVDTPLLIGMTIDCNIIVGERADALLIPAAAVADGKVWLVQEGRLARRAVTLGVAGDRAVEVRRGLEAGDLVVARPIPGLREGRRARVAGAS
jgi:RND family efflux transporter MFP subunit